MKKKNKFFYNYRCSLTGENFKIYEKVQKPQDLMSIEAYYQLHPEEDDRPASIKQKVALKQS